jgi:hypothetical protein
MENNINKKVLNNDMNKKFLMIISLLLLCIFSGYSVDLNYNQEKAISSFVGSKIGMSHLKIVLGNSNDVTIGNRTGDIKFELVGVTKSVFLRIDNNVLNNTFNITYVNDDNAILGGEAVIITQELTMDELGMYYFEFIPSYEGEGFDFIIQFDDGLTMPILLAEENPIDTTLIVTGFLTALEELVDLNVYFWVILFYAFLFGITLAFTLLVFGLGFLTFKYARRLRKQREEGMM